MKAMTREEVRKALGLKSWAEHLVHRAHVDFLHNEMYKQAQNGGA